MSANKLIEVNLMIIEFQGLAVTFCLPIVPNFPQTLESTKSGIPKLAQRYKLLESQLFEISIKLFESFKNDKIIYWLRFDIYDHILKILS